MHSQKRQGRHSKWLSNWRSQRSNASPYLVWLRSCSARSAAREAWFPTGTLRALLINHLSWQQPQFPQHPPSTLWGERRPTLCPVTFWVTSKLTGLLPTQGPRLSKLFCQRDSSSSSFLNSVPGVPQTSGSFNDHESLLSKLVEIEQWG